MDSRKKHVQRTGWVLPVMILCSLFGVTTFQATARATTETVHTQTEDTSLDEGDSQPSNPDNRGKQGPKQPTVVASLPFCDGFESGFLAGQSETYLYPWRQSARRVPPAAGVLVAVAMRLTIL